MAEEEEQFEQVLNRLDALMKRSHAGTVPPLSESALEHKPVAAGIYFHLEPIEPVDENAAEPLEVKPEDAALDVSVAIPVLTEVYEGDFPASPFPLPETLSAAASPEISPELLASIQRTVDEECDNLRRSLTERLQAEVAAALQRK
jgi:hypothetical protein